MSSAEYSPQEQSPTEFPTLGKFRLLKEVSVDGNIRTYHATFDAMGGFVRPCTIKRFYSGGRSPAAVEAFTEVATRAASWRHPNIIQAFDFGRAGDDSFVALEYVDGFSVQGLLDAAKRANRALGPRVALWAGMTLCETVEYLLGLNSSVQSGQSSIDWRALFRQGVITCDVLELKLNPVVGHDVAHEDPPSNPAQIALHELSLLMGDLCFGSVADSAAPQVPAALLPLVGRNGTASEQVANQTPRELWNELRSIKRAETWGDVRDELKQILWSVAPDWAGKLDSAVTLAPTPSAPRLGTLSDVDIDIEVEDAPLAPTSSKKRWVLPVGGALMLLAAVGFFMLRPSAGDVRAAMPDHATSARAQAHRQAGLAAMDEGNYEAAVKAFSAAAALEPLGDAAELAKMAKELGAKSKSAPAAQH